MNKPKCAVGGMLEGGRAICGRIIVGGVHCGYGGECEHKGPADPEPIAVQACRPEDRAMLQTDAGREMVAAAVVAMEKPATGGEV